MGLEIYLRYKLHCMKSASVESMISLRKIRTYVSLYQIWYFISIFVYYTVPNSKVTPSIIILGGLIAILLSIYHDYLKGFHMHWWRKNKKMEAQQNYGI